MTCRADSRTVWEITVTEGRDGLLRMEGDAASLPAMAHECAFLAQVAAGHTTLATLRAALDAGGAVDETARVGPYATMAD